MISTNFECSRSFSDSIAITSKFGTCMYSWSGLHGIFSFIYKVDPPPKQNDYSQV